LSDSVNLRRKIAAQRAARLADYVAFATLGTRMRHVVAMDHLCASGNPQDLRNIARIAAADALRVKGVISNESSADLGPPLVADRDAIAAREYALNARHSGRQEAFAAG
jgi:D-serine deaminase-like pyridoxal phosphate-dependent protein